MTTITRKILLVWSSWNRRHFGAFGGLRAHSSLSICFSFYWHTNPMISFWCDCPRSRTRSNLDSVEFRNIRAHLYRADSLEGVVLLPDTRVHHESCRTICYHDPILGTMTRLGSTTWVLEVRGSLSSPCYATSTFCPSCAKSTDCAIFLEMKTPPRRNFRCQTVRDR